MEGQILAKTPALIQSKVENSIDDLKIGIYEFTLILFNRSDRWDRIGRRYKVVNGFNTGGVKNDCGKVEIKKGSVLLPFCLVVSCYRHKGLYCLSMFISVLYKNPSTILKGISIRSVGLSCKSIPIPVLASYV